MADYKLFINGEYVEAQSGETFTTSDPATGQPIGEVAKAGRIPSEPSRPLGRPSTKAPGPACRARSVATS